MNNMIKIMEGGLEMRSCEYPPPSIKGVPFNSFILKICSLVNDTKL